MDGYIYVLLVARKTSSHGTRFLSVWLFFVPWDGKKLTTDMQAMLHSAMLDQNVIAKQVVMHAPFNADGSPCNFKYSS